MAAQRGEPARAWAAVDRWRPPDTRLDNGATGREVHDLTRTDAEHGVYAGLDTDGAVRIRTQAPIGDAHVPWLSGRVDRRHLSEIVGEQGRDHAEEPPGAGMEEPQQSRDGNAAPRPLHVRLAEGIL
jgi:hypothetical protein